MDPVLYDGGPDAEPHTAPSMRGERLSCTICQRRLGRSIFFLEETGDLPTPRQSWTLCKDCNDAVKLQMATTPLRTPLRLRVAVGIVATERTPVARRARWGKLTDSQWTTLLFWSFLLAMLVHLAIIVFVATLAGSR